MLHFEAAPWPTSLKVSSGLGLVLLVAVSYGAVDGIPLSGFSHWFGTGVACIPPLVGILSALYVVRGYDVGGGTLYVRRLLWSTPIPLAGIVRISQGREQIRCAKRVFGNGGLFAFTGVYQHDALGRFRLFATDPARAVVLVLARRVVVVTPATPHAFVQHLRRAFPAVEVEEPVIEESPPARSEEG